jgi:hypothetical protein
MFGGKSMTKAPKGKVYVQDRSGRVQTIFRADQLALLDAYRRTLANPPSRAEAVRHLCTAAISAKGILPTLDESAA